MWKVKIVLIASALCFASADDDEIVRNVSRVEKLFLEFNPDTDYIPWEETANLTAESLKELCDQMLPIFITPSDPPYNGNYTYEPYDNPEDFRLERMVKYALLPIRNYYEMAHVPVIKCFYKEKRFFLTHADDGKVFDLDVEDLDQDIYTLKSGMYPCQVPK